VVRSQAPGVDGRTTDTRQRAVAVATDCVVRRGFSATSLQHIADELGISKAALYYHFDSKAELVREVLRPMVEDIDAFVDRYSTDRPDSVRQLLEDYVELTMRHRELLLAISRDPSGIALVDSGQWIAFWTGRVQELLVGEDADDDARVRAMVAVAGLGRVFLLPGIEPERLRQLAVDVALDLLGAAD